MNPIYLSELLLCLVVALGAVSLTAWLNMHSVICNLVGIAVMMLCVSIMIGA
jgi:hypothetical protein